MPDERFPKVNRKEGQAITRALTKKNDGSPEGIHDAGVLDTLANVRTVPGPKIDKEKAQIRTKEGFEFDSNEDSILIPLEKGSVQFMLFDLLKKKYPHLSLGSGQRREVDRDFYLEIKDTDPVILGIFSDLIVKVLEMEEPDDAREAGFALEEGGKLEVGITDRSYARYLQNKIFKQKRSTDLAIMKEFMDNSHELNGFRERGIEPLTDEEIIQILEQVIERVFKGKEIE